MKLLFNIAEIPFSRRGSYFALSNIILKKAIYIRDVHGGDESPSELFELKMATKENEFLTYEEFEKEFVIEATETLVTIYCKKQPNRFVKIILPKAEQLRIQVVGLQLKLVAVKIRYDSLNQLEINRYEYLSYKKETKYQLDFIGNNFKVNAPWYRVGNTSIELLLDGLKEAQELMLTNYQVTPPLINLENLLEFNLAQEEIAQDYQEWLAQTLNVPERYQQARSLASYIIWSSIVRPEGLLTREAVYMSKNWMQNIWSWDNCFNAMGIGTSQPELAYEQFLIFCDHQDQSGVYPDFINNQFRSYNCCKPPIHAWAYQQLMDKATYYCDENRLAKIYDSIANSTFFWLNYRLSSKTGLPYYTHGNDSGWDNASVFHHGLPVVSPDLTAYLIQQMSVLSQWAKRLGKNAESLEWQQRATFYGERLVAELYEPETGQFVAKSERTGQVIPEKNSLLLFLPLVIADYLPQEIVETLIATVIKRFEGPFGLRTEAQSSPHYQADGYWLGPIWAPASYLFFDAFMRAGQTQLATRLAEKYCQLATAGGMAENYNPETGAGNDDLSFTWTSSVFLLLGNYLKVLESDE